VKAVKAVDNIPISGLYMGEFIKSRGDGRLVKAATVLPPPVRDKAYLLFAFVDTGFWRLWVVVRQNPVGD
jgi:hypothetical protein